MVNHGILHVHSEYSIHDSAVSPKEIVKRAAEMGCKNITLTDHGTLLGIDDFMDAGKEYGINTIPGVEAYLEGRQHLILIAKNYNGFRVISRVMRDANEHQIVKKFNTREFVYPIVTKEILESIRGNTDIIVSSACIQGPVCVPLLQGFYVDAENDKIKLEMMRLKPDVNKYKSYVKKVFLADDELKSTKKERTLFAKYTKPAYQEQISNNERKLAQYQALIDAGNPEGSKAVDTKIEKAKQKTEELAEKIKNMKEVRESAFSFVKRLDDEIKTLKSNKKSLMGERDVYKKQKNKYDKLKGKLDASPSYAAEDLYQEALETAIYFKELFPDFYLEVQNHGLKQEKLAMPLVVSISKETGVPLIAANDAHMKDGTKESLEARQLVRFNYFAKHQRISDADKGLYIKSDEELLEALSGVIPKKEALQAIENTKILEECNVVFPNEKHYPTCESEKSFEELLEEARSEKIKEGVWNETYEKRLRHEMSIIQTMGYVDYHMVVRDFCIAGKKLGVIPKRELANMPETYQETLDWISYKGFSTGVGVGPGRGSAVGSLVCYLLGITNIDPLKYNLLFERFLNPERVSMPDIDTDIKTSLRPYIIRYCKEKRGQRAVTSISTTNRYAAKASIQMAGRDRADELYGYLPKDEKIQKKREYQQFVRKISDLIPLGAKETLQKNEELFEKQFSDDEEAVLIWERAKLIEGHVNGTGVHAGGIVISDNDDVNEYVPLAWNKDMNVWTTQCDMIRVEEKGMLKIDILGLLTLDCISDTLHLIKKNYGISINPDTIPFEPEVFREIYSKGYTNSVFQVESAGMKNMMREFKPECIEDLILLLAMYRPGPMQFIPDLIEIKNGRKELTYKTPMLEPILKDTYGAISYQEQVMQIFQSLAGYSLGQADMVRRAMSKKKAEKLKIERNAFIYGDEERGISGCVKNGISAEVGNALFNEITDFAKYAFNKSHAAAYAIVSYQTAWLKCHYPKEYLCSMFNNKSQDQFEPIVEDCVTYGIELLPPDINLSGYDFQIEGESIRYGLSGIKGIADVQTVDKIVQERKKKRFDTFSEFVERFAIEGDEKCSFFDKDVMEALIRSGCFDGIYPKRVALDALYKDTEWSQPKESIVKHFDVQPSVSNSVLQMQEWEMEYMKQCISSNPLKLYKDDSYYGCIPYSDLKDGRVSIFGYLSSYEFKVSNAGNKLLLIHLIGKSGKMTIMFMRDKYDYYEKFVPEYANTVVRISGTYHDGILFGNSMERLEVAKNSYSYICDTEHKYRRILELVKVAPGMEDLNVYTFFAGKDTAESPIVRLNKPKMFQMKVSKTNYKKLTKIEEKPAD